MIARTSTLRAWIDGRMMLVLCRAHSGAASRPFDDITAIIEHARRLRWPRNVLAGCCQSERRYSEEKANV